MKNIYINVAHSSFSPGGVWGKRNEHTDSLKFSSALKKELLKYKDIQVKMCYGKEYEGVFEDAIFLSFHRDGNMKNCEKYGAAVYVDENASADIQFDAFRLLKCFTGKEGFRYRGVHTCNKNSPFKEIMKTGGANTFVFTLGFMDKERDNICFDRNLTAFAKILAFRLNEILKEREYEDNTAFHATSGRGE